MAVLGLQLPSEGPAVAGVLVAELRACNHIGQGLQEQAPGCTGCLQRDGGHRLQWQGPGVGQWVGELQWQSVGLQWGGRQRLRLQLPGLQWQSMGLQRGGRQRLRLQLLGARLWEETVANDWTETAGEGCRKLTSQRECTL